MFIGGRGGRSEFRRLETSEGRRRGGASIGVGLGTGLRGRAEIRVSFVGVVSFNNSVGEQQTRPPSPPPCPWTDRPADRRCFTLYHSALQATSDPPSPSRGLPNRPAIRHTVLLWVLLKKALFQGAYLVLLCSLFIILVTLHPSLVPWTHLGELMELISNNMLKRHLNLRQELNACNQGLEKVRTSKSNKLVLYFRPEDPYSHPACGQHYPCKNLLLKISRKRDNNCLYGASINQSKCAGSGVNSIDTYSVGNKLEKVDSASGSTTLIGDQVPDRMPCRISADIVAHVEEAYHFNGMADYQHVLAIHADVACKKKRTWSDVETSNENGAAADVDENLMILAPPLFSLKDIPENLVLRPSVTLSSKKKLEGVVQHRWEMDIEPCLAIDFNIKEIPNKVNWEGHISRTSDQWEPQVAVSKLFDERPIWAKASVIEHLSSLGFNLRERLLKRLLFRVAYYFGSGPFHRFWIRKGYDPRKDPESRIYQRIDFRIPPDLRTHCDALNGTKHRWKDICSFRVFPSKYHIYLQMCELADEFIQQEISKPPKQTVCTPATGWFTSHVLHTLRLRIALKFLSVRPLAGAEELLKSVSDKFEKSKKICYQQPIVKPSDGVSQLNEEIVDEDKEAANEDDEEENEIEDDDAEAEEEMYAYYPNLDADDAGFSLEPDTYPDGESMSKNYLQELFGSFPLANGDGAGFNNPESDDEYHIFEHESDQSSDDGY